MLKIRLQRIGRKHEPSFRLVLTDSKNSTKSGKSIETLGSHDFRKDTTTIEADRVKHWISKGAKPTDTVHNLLLSHKIIEGKKINVLPKKTVPKKDPPATPTEAGPAGEVVEAPAPAPVEVTTPEATSEKAPETEPVAQTVVAEEPKAEPKDLPATAEAKQAGEPAPSPAPEAPAPENTPAPDPEVSPKDPA